MKPRFPADGAFSLEQSGRVSGEAARTARQDREKYAAELSTAGLSRCSSLAHRCRVSLGAAHRPSSQALTVQYRYFSGHRVVARWSTPQANSFLAVALPLNWGYDNVSLAPAGRNIYSYGIKRSSIGADTPPSRAASQGRNFPGAAKNAQIEFVLGYWPSKHYVRSFLKATWK
jgi:hypothetical protein